MHLAFLLTLPLLSSYAILVAYGQCEFLCRPEKVLLFAIRAHSRKRAIVEFYKSATQDTLMWESVPDLFRSQMLDNLPAFIKLFGANRIVAEMRKDGVPVARAVFNVSWNTEALTLHNWFAPERLVETYPFWTGNVRSNFVDMSIRGHVTPTYSRSFYIHHSHTDCYTESGLMGISEDIQDNCTWTQNGLDPPVFFYAKRKGTYLQDKSINVVDYADHFLVYLQ